jgi:hypothetical protein
LARKASSRTGGLGNLGGGIRAGSRQILGERIPRATGDWRESCACEADRGTLLALGHTQYRFSILYAAEQSRRGGDLLTATERNGSLPRSTTGRKFTSRAEQRRQSRPKLPALAGLVTLRSRPPREPSPRDRPRVTVVWSPSLFVSGLIMQRVPSHVPRPIDLQPA